MCEPIAIFLAARGFATAIQGIGQLQHGRQVQDAMEQSAQGSDRSAAEAAVRGQSRELQSVLHAGAVTAGQKVAYSGSGVLIGAGASAATERATEAISDVDRQTIERNAALEAYGHRERARAFRQQGEYAAAEGRRAALGTFLGGLGGALGEGGKHYADVRSGSGGGFTSGELFSDFADFAD